MANDERQSETFIREVDEELRREQLKTLWKRFAPLIIGICVLIVVVTAGYRGWIWWEERKAAQGGDRFMEALAKIEAGDRATGEADLQALAAEGDAGYSALARLRLAGEKAAASAKAEALSAYDAVAADPSVPLPLRDVARIRGAILALDMGDVAGAKERAAPLNVSGNPWRHAAREVIGTANYQAGDLQAARDAFSEVQADQETPPDLWVRSGLMVSLIDGQLAAPSTAPATDSAAPATDDAGAPATGSTTPEPPAPIAPDPQVAPEAAAPSPAPETAAPAPTPAPATPAPATPTP